EHDLSRLFAALEALALEEETQKALNKVRGDLPDAQYHRGLSTTPQLSTGRPGKKMRARPHENAGAGTAEKAGAPPAKVRRPAPAKTPGEIEPGYTESSNRVRPEISSEESNQRASASRSDTSDDAANDTIALKADDEVRPGYFDDGIAQYIQQW